ncbi:hypothetical protein [Nitrincola sp. MINF-07-Sa-05]|uniref:hypothetical protein n=1 Tax=Nitrincola salilacus TaxID=3400273 RepID=UPI00391856AD
MTISLLPIQSSFDEKMLRDRLSVTLNEKKLFKVIDDDPDLVGAGVIFIDNRGIVVTLREFKPLCSFKPVNVVLREPPKSYSADTYAAEVRSSDRESRLVSEATGATLSCGSAVLGWIVIFTAGGALGFTGGASGVVIAVTYGAAIAGTLQCINGGVRTGSELLNPQVNDDLDSEEWYRNTIIALDTISLAGAGAAGLVTIKGLKMLKSNGIPTRKALEGLNRQERRRLSREIARANAPGISNGALKMMERTGQIERRYSNAAIRRTTLLQIKDAAGAGLSFTGSAVGGNIKLLAIAVVKEE